MSSFGSTPPRRSTPFYRRPLPLPSLLPVCLRLSCLSLAAPANGSTDRFRFSAVEAGLRIASPSLRVASVVWPLALLVPPQSGVRKFRWGQHPAIALADRTH